MRRLYFIALLLIIVMAGSAQQRRTGTSRQRTTTTARKTTTTKKKRTTTKKKTTTKAKTSSSSIKGLQNEQAQVKKQIRQHEQKLRQNELDVKKRLKNLMEINSEIEDKRKTIDTIRRDITTLTGDIRLLEQQLDRLHKELDDRKDKYVKSMRYMHRNRSIQNQLMFVFSAKSFTQMYRRMRFMREYATYQRVQGEMVKEKQAEVTEKHKQLTEAKNHKSTLLARGERERANLENKQTEQKQVVSTLQKQQKTIQQLIEKQRKRDAELNAKIERLIAEELERARARAEAEARRKAAAEAAARAAEKERREKENRTAKSTRNKTKTKREVTETKKTGGLIYNMDSEDRRISGSFESNRGRLPMPISGGYRIVSHFGQYNVEGLKGVRLDNKGISIQGQPGAQVRSVFDGEVSAVFNYAGKAVIMVRHGSYISVYSNFSTVSVHKGQKIKVRQPIGVLDGDNILQFQLYREKTKLNPESWLGR